MIYKSGTFKNRIRELEITNKIHNNSIAIVHVSIAIASHYSDKRSSLVARSEAYVAHFLRHCDTDGVAHAFSIVSYRIFIDCNW